MLEVRQILPQGCIWGNLFFVLVLESEESRIKIVFSFLVLVTIENTGRDHASNKNKSPLKKGSDINKSE